MAKTTVKNVQNEVASIKDVLNLALELAPTQIIRSHIAKAIAELTFTIKNKE